MEHVYVQLYMYKVITSACTHVQLTCTRTCTCTYKVRAMLTSTFADQSMGQSLKGQKGVQATLLWYSVYAPHLKGFSATPTFLA